MKREMDERWMRRALALAEKGRGTTSPNPTVGACLVKGDRLIAEGFHASFGGPHAEAAALQKAKKKARGASLYVTLEPCSTYGKTPPCTEAILKAKVREVIIGTLDPNPVHRGKGAALLRRAGVKVRAHVLKDECKRQIEDFSRWITTGRPFVTLKMAQSLDGKIATWTGNSRWISGREAREWVHGIRSKHDALLVGTNTLLRDDPRLTVRPRLYEPKVSERNVAIHRHPWRIILDQRGRSSPKARVFRSDGPVLLVCAERYLSHVARKFEKTRATILALRQKKGRLDLRELMDRLGLFGMTSVLVEGGGEIAWSLFREGLADRIFWIISPKVIGGRSAKTSVEGEGIKSLSEAFPVHGCQMKSLGKDYLLEGYTGR